MYKRQVDAHIAADLRFHSAILEAAGNELLLGLRHGMEGAWNAAIRLSTQSKADGASSLALHKALADAIAKGKPAAARAATEKLVDRWAADGLRIVAQARAAKARSKTRATPPGEAIVPGKAGAG